MKKLLFAILFLLLSLMALAVRYVVDTKGAYANLREEASTKSKVLLKLKNKDEMVLWNEKGDWYSVGVLDKSSNEAYVDGYIHKSQVKLHPEIIKR